MSDLNTHGVKIEFGKHKGELLTRVPKSYLRWMANELEGERKDLALAELARRGTAMPKTTELSGHAIDRASQITNAWKEQGVYTWLLNLAEEARIREPDQEVVYLWGYKLVFEYGDYYPVLKTIIKKKNANQNRQSR